MKDGPSLLVEEQAKLYYGKKYLKQQLLKDSFEVKRYGKGLLVKTKEKEMYKILIDGACTEDEDNSFKKKRPIRSSILGGAQYIIKI